MANSLTDFFARPGSVTLDNCDREPIHLSQAIQGVGALLAIDEASSEIIAASGNAADVLGLGNISIEGLTLAQVHADLARLIDMFAVAETGVHSVIELQIEHGDQIYDPIVHWHQSKLIIELMPNNGFGNQELRRSLRLVRESSARMARADHFETALQIAAQTAREITGFDRVKVYKFLPDWSGKVVAEARDPSMPSYLGLHFPDTDIPKQARELYLNVPYRSVCSVHDDNIGIHGEMFADEPIDLTWSLIRSVSPMHTRYLRNMGVEATFSAGLVYRGRLWGLIACHHRQPKVLPFDYWGMMHDLGTALINSFEQKTLRQTAKMVSSVRMIETNLATEMRAKDNLEDVIKDFLPIFLELMQADGFAIRYGKKIYLEGTTPPKAFIEDLLLWLQNNADQLDQFQTNKLHAIWPPAKEYIETACGILAQPIAVHRVCHLIWFRAPVTRSVHWAGNPGEKDAAQSDDPLAMLLPRKSFASWRHEHKDQSQEWDHAELETAREVLKEILDIIASQLDLSEENMALRNFATTAAHDIKAPLRGIRFALDVMREENFAPDAIDEYMRIADTSAERLAALTNSLYELATLKSAQPTLYPVSIRQAVDDTRTMLTVSLKECGAELTCDDIPDVMADQNLLTTVIMNLTYNSIKYLSKDRPLRIHISGAQTSFRSVEITIEDNGIGVKPRHAEKIFEMMERLHNDTEIEGVGLGLTMCRRIIDKLNGSIHLDQEQRIGCKFIINLQAVHH